MTVYYFYPEDKLPTDIKIDSIVVYKSERHLLAYASGRLVKTYDISLGRQPVGAKEFEGDKKTPEGIYFINDKNIPIDCFSYHKNFWHLFTISDKDNIEEGKANWGGKGSGWKMLILIHRIFSETELVLLESFNVGMTGP